MGMMSHFTGQIRKYFNEEPPDLVSLIKKFFSGKNKDIWQAHAGKGRLFAGHGGKFVVVLLLVAVIIWVLAGIYIVAPAEQAVVLRFGRYFDTVNPGPHWIPRFMDTKTTLNVQQINNFKYSSEMLTKDENIVSVSLAVQYRIEDPKNYLFSVIDPINAVRQATSSALRQVVGQMTLDSVLTTGREELRQQVATQLNKTLKIYHTGLLITDVVLQPAKPPQAVIHAFDDAIKAREDEQTSINQAEAYNRQELAIVKGTIARIQQQADAYKLQVVLQAKGDVSRYLALLNPYEKSPYVTGKRLYLDTVSAVLSHTTNILVDSNGTNVMYLPIDKILQGNMKSIQKTSGIALNSNLLPANRLDTGSSNSYPNRPGTYGGDQS